MAMTNRYDVCGIGNAMVDTEYEVEQAFLDELEISKGVMTLIDDERMAFLGAELLTRYSIKKHAGGGSAANTMVALSQFGGKAFYCCRVARDDLGDFFLTDLSKVGIDSNIYDNRARGVTGECLVMITPDADRTMNTYLGVTAEFSKRDLSPPAIADAEFLYIEGYLATSPTGRRAVKRAQTVARANGTKIALTLSDPSVVEAFKDVFETFIADGVDLLFCNEDEARIWSGKDDIDAAAEALKSAAQNFIVTLGPRGALVFDGSESTVVPTPAVDAVDTNGAGDMFAGAFLYGITHGMSHQDAATLANRAASKLVSEFGARLDPITQRALLD